MPWKCFWHGHHWHPVGPGAKADCALVLGEVRTWAWKCCRCPKMTTTSSSTIHPNESYGD